MLDKQHKAGIIKYQIDDIDCPECSDIEVDNVKCMAMTPEQLKEMYRKDYLATLRTYHQVGFEIIPKWKAAWLMAIVTVWGNNEGFTLSPKFQVEREFIQEIYHINGGEVPDDEEFNAELRDYVRKAEAVTSGKDPFFRASADLIAERYNFKLYC